MNPRHSLGSLLLATSLLTGGLAVEPVKVLPLWPGVPPGDQGGLPAEKDLTKPTDNLIAGRPVIRLGNVSQPTISVYRPAPEKDTGASVVVCPGGGYHILALDLEGTEVCEWLNSLGVTGVLLKYRVPKRPDREPHAAPLQDVQRAVGLVRSHAGEWGLDPKRVGVLGFSAGGHLAALLSNNYQQRSYPRVDAADDQNCRPDFAVLVYAANLTDKDRGEALRPEMAVTTNTPPTFMAITQDDPVRVENALFYGAGLHRAKVPFELHVYPTGGHGYGLRRTDNPVTAWPDRAAEWMRFQGWLKKP